MDIVYHFLDVLSDDEIQAGFDKFKSKFASDHCSSMMNVSSRNPFKSLSKKASVRVAMNIELF